MSIIGRDLLLETLPDYIAGAITPISQEEDKATFSPNIMPQEEKIDWQNSARSIFNQIRGMYPWPVAHTFLNEKRFKIYEAKEATGKGKPGTVIVKTKKELIIATSNGAISLKTVQLEGKPKMSITDFLNGVGRTIEVGDVFGE